ncbi:hypothetical protein [Serratia nevei]|uniref:hypothetical protein n=1 Tax=Serratia nevei TaxID=2703794 RepID=UPI00313BF8C9
MTKALIEFTPDHHDKQTEAMARYHAKLDALRSVLIDRGSCDSKEALETIAENISAAFDKINLEQGVEVPGKLVSYRLLEHYQGMSKQQCSIEATRLAKVASEKGNIFSVLSNLLILENIYNAAK